MSPCFRDNVSNAETTRTFHYVTVYRLGSRHHKAGVGNERCVVLVCARMCVRARVCVGAYVYESDIYIYIYTVCICGMMIRMKRVFKRWTISECIFNITKAFLYFAVVLNQASSPVHLS